MPALEVSTARGHRFSAMLYPQTDTGRPVVIICPAMGVQGKYYGRLAETLQQQGLRHC